MTTSSSSPPVDPPVHAHARGAARAHPAERSEREHVAHETDRSDRHEGDEQAENVRRILARLDPRLPGVVASLRALLDRGLVVFDVHLANLGTRPNGDVVLFDGRVEVALTAAEVRRIVRRVRALKAEAVARQHPASAMPHPLS